LSPSIWGDCPLAELNALHSGQFFDAKFDTGVPTGVVASGVVRPTVAGLTLECDDDTVLARLATLKGLRIETDADDNDAASLSSGPLGPITRNSGKRLWLEAIVAAGDVDADMGIFVGLVEPAGATRDVLADNVAATAVVGESLVGFIQDNGDDDALDIIYRKDAGTVVVVASDVTNSTAIPVASRASLTDGAFFKVGIRFDGHETLSFYVGGYRVATLTIDTTFDQVKEYCAVLGIKTGTGAAEQVHIQRFRAAAHTAV
jgi:hypothetical protein